MSRPGGEFREQGDAEWIVIRGQLRGHNDTPFGVGPGVGRPKGVFGGFIYFQLVILFFEVVPLMMEFTWRRRLNRIRSPFRTTIFKEPLKIRDAVSKGRVSSVEWGKLEAKPGNVLRTSEASI
jgi:hypothetical protein